MTPWLDDGDVRLYHGDALEVLRGLPDGSVDCVVTSPPYWGLRDYGTGEWAGGDPDCEHDQRRRELDPDSKSASNTGAARDSLAGRDGCRKCGATRVDQQMGLEPTPDLFVQNMVQVFREIRRVLADHGTCWVNLGDSYASSPPGNVAGVGATSGLHGANDPSGTYRETLKAGHATKRNTVVAGLKPKDLVGIPWSVAKALQEPYYTGRILRERDRAWLAATIDAEGSVCGFTHERSDGDGTRTGIHITITNTSMPMLAEAQRIWPTSRDDGNGHGVSALGTRECRRWIAHNVDDKAALLAELYPYLIAKRTQALLAWNFLQMSREAKRIGKTAEGAKAKERRAWIVGALSDLNHGRDVVVPSWIAEPPSLYEDGWYLRSDIVWAKPNPMPESVTDRPTKSHEFIFLLTKRPRYWFDTEAVREPHSPDNRTVTTVQGGNGSIQHRDGERWPGTGRNVRSVWQIATQPYPEAHFATFPEELARRCILAGCPVRVCRVCGKPSERIVERGESDYARMKAKGIEWREMREAAVEDGKGHDSNRAHIGGTRNENGKAFSYTAAERTDLGWSDCGHNNWRPGTVLDPFMGSGTVAKVARDHQRHAIGIDLNTSYLELAARRLQQLSLLNEVEA